MERTKRSRTSTDALSYRGGRSITPERKLADESAKSYSKTLERNESSPREDPSYGKQRRVSPEKPDGESREGSNKSRRNEPANRSPSYKVAARTPERGKKRKKSGSRGKRSTPADAKVEERRRRKSKSPKERDSKVARSTRRRSIETSPTRSHGSSKRRRSRSHGDRKGVEASSGHYRDSSKNEDRSRRHYQNSRKSERSHGFRRGYDDGSPGSTTHRNGKVHNSSHDRRDADSRGRGKITAREDRRFSPHGGNHKAEDDWHRRDHSYRTGYSRGPNLRRSGTCVAHYEGYPEYSERHSPRFPRRAGTSYGEDERRHSHAFERGQDRYRSDKGGQRERSRIKRDRSQSARSNKRFRGDSPKGRDDRHRGREEVVQKVVDDENGHLVFNVGYKLHDRYTILGELGEGTFGKVVKCVDNKKDKIFALKIIRNIKKYRDAAKLEINVLNKLAKYDPKGKYFCVQMHDAFDFHGHKCIAFELLGKSVFDFLKDNDYYPYPIEHVRQITYELCIAVNFLHKNRLTHTDLKPENILFHDSNYSKENGKRILLNPEIRLIDFGSATFDHEHHSSIIQTRHYRAPEVVLKLGWDQSCDVWSIGCIIFELALGNMMFDTHSSLEHLAMMERVLGTFPQDFASKSTLSYFSKGKLIWTEGSKEDRHVRRKVKPLERYVSRDSSRDWVDMFHLIRRMLEFHPKKRITLEEALEHEFLKRFAMRKGSRSSSGYVSR